MKQGLIGAALVATALALSACSTVAGAGAGAVIGNNTGDGDAERGAVIGGAAGAIGDIIDDD